MSRFAATPPRLVTLILLSALSVLPVNMFLPSLPAIAETFRADYGLVTLSVAGYAAVAAAMQLLLGPLSDRFGRRPVILAGLAVFVLASAGCAVAEDIRVFLAFRLLQATVTAGYIVSLAVIRDTAPAGAAASRIGYLAMAWALAPMLGPTAGGLLDALFGWRASFWTFAGLGGAVLALCWADLGETNRAPSATVRSQFRAYPALVRAPAFWAHALCMALSTGAFYAFLTGAPIVARSAYALPPDLTGMYMGTITAGFVAGSFLSGRLAGRHPLSTTMIAGRIAACAGTAAGLALYLAGAAHEAALFGPCVLVGLGNGLTMPSASAGALSVRPALAGSAAGLAGAVTVGGGAVVAAFAGLIPEGNAGAGARLAVLLGVLAAALSAALWARRLEAGGRSPGAAAGQAT